MLERLDPHPLPEVAAPQQPAIGADEDQPVLTVLREARQVPAHNRRDQLRDADRAPARVGLGRAELESRRFRARSASALRGRSGP
jgi:hypothetical protein